MSMDKCSFSSQELRDACLYGRKNKVLYLLNRGVDPNSDEARDLEGETPLHYACQHGWLDVVQLLVEDYKCAVEVRANRLSVEDCPEYSQMTPLHSACKYGNVELANVLIEKYQCNPNVVDRYRSTPLHYALDHNHIGLAIELVIHGANPTVADSDGNTPLHKACYYGQLHFVKYLFKIEAKCNPNAKNMAGLTPLHVNLCSSTYDSDITKELITYGANPNVTDKEGDTPLHKACYYGRLGAVKYLIVVAKCDPNALNKARLTPIHVSLSSPRCVDSDIIDQLIEHGANPSMARSNGDTPLHIACQAGELESVKCLLATTKCDQNAKNKAGLTPLQVVFPRHFKIVKELVAHGANPNVTDSDGNTPLHKASYYGQLDSVKYFLTVAKCDPNVKNKAGSTPLNVLSWYANSDIMKELIAHGANPNIGDNDGNIPLHKACFYGRLDFVKCLLTVPNCDPNTKNKAGLTPLYFDLNVQCDNRERRPFTFPKRLIVDVKFLTCAYSDIMKELIAHGANPNVGDSDGNTPLHYACYLVQLEFVQCLLLVAKSDPNVKNKAGFSPLQANLSSLCCADSNTIKELIGHGANPNVVDNDGNTPLHKACDYQRPDCVKCLLAEAKCDPNIRNKAGQTPLLTHVNLQSWRHIYSDITKELIAHGANPNIADRDGNTLLHGACYSGQLRYVKYLLAVPNCDPNIKNTAGDTPLHSNLNSPLYTDADITKELVVRGANPNMADNKGNTPVHVACETGRLDSVVCLLTVGKCDPNSKNKAGDTPLHSYLNSPLYTDADITKELVVRGANSNVADIKGNTPVHIACQTGRLDSVVCLLTVGKCDPNSKNKAGDTPLHSYLNSLMYSDSGIVKELIVYGAKANEVDSDCNTPLHIACKTGRLDSVEYLLVITKCDPNAKNKAGLTPLHVNINSSRYSNSHIVIKLITHGANSNLADNEGNTPLHFSCQSDRFYATKYILTATDCNPNIKNKDGLTPLQVTLNRSTKIIRELIRCGANTNDVYKKHRRVLKQPIQPPVKVFVVGNPSVGKSTLTSAIQKEKFFVRPFTKPQKVTGVDKRTAGIVPHEFESKEYGCTTFYDFAGQRQFYGSHAAMLQNAIQSSPPVFLIVVDICESEDEITKTILYWLSFSENQCSSVSSKPHVIIVGSHADVLKERGEDPELKLSCLKPNTEEFSSKFVFAGFIVIDCQYPISRGMNELRQCLKNSCNALRMRETITFNAHCFYIYLVDKFKVSIAVTVEQIQTQIKAELSFGTPTKHNVMNFIPDSLHHLCKICVELNDRGHILFLKDSQVIEQSWVVLDKKCLLNKVSGSIFAPEHFKQHTVITQCKCSTGVVPLSSIANSFPEYSPKLLTKFLSCLEFCREISDPEILRCITAEHRTCIVKGPAHDPGEHYFLFPALVSLNVPTNVWDDKPQYSHHCGWILHCSTERPEQFFTPRFLQVLLLRMATMHSFPLSEGDKMQSNPAVQRNCSIWKNGIFWGNDCGVETLVEMIPDNKAVIVLMRCCDTAMVDLVELRSQVIRQVHNAVERFCHSIDTTESMIDPSERTQYPLKPVSHLKLFSISNISKAVVESKDAAAKVVSPTGTIPLENLLQCEPYAGLGEVILWEMFDSRAHDTEIIPDSFLTRIIEAKAKHLDTFVKMFFPEHEPQSIVTLQDCFSILKTWRAGCAGTYKSLRQKLDEFSVFAGRNPLTLAGFTKRQQRPKPKTMLAKVWNPQSTVQEDEDEYSRMEAMPLKGVKPTIELLHVLKHGGRRVKIIESVAAEWEELAIALGFEAPVINYLKRDFSRNSIGATTQVLTKWLSGESDLDKPIAWDTLIDSLDNAGQAGLAEDLRELLIDDSRST